MASATDQEIEQEISRGTLAWANVRIAFRQMKALEAIAAAAQKLANPPVVLGYQALGPSTKVIGEDGSIATLPSHAGAVGESGERPAPIRTIAERFPADEEPIGESPRGRRHKG